MLTVREVAARLKVCTATVYRICERGELPHLRISNALRIPLAALIDYVRAAPLPDAREEERGER